MTTEWMSWNFRQIYHGLGCELPLSVWKIPIELQWEKCCGRSSTSFLIGSSSFLQVGRTCIKAWMSLIFRQTRQLTTESAALERLENQRFHLFISPEPPGSQGDRDRRQQFQTSSPPKPLCQSKANFMWRHIGMGEQKFIY